MNKRIPILLGFILIVLAVWIQITSVDSVRSFILRLDNLAYDMQLRTRLYTHPTPPTSPVVIVDIDDKSLQVEGHWPWPRSKLADLISRLHDEGAVIVAMDMMFPENEPNISQSILQVLENRKLDTPAFTTVLKQIQPELDNDTVFAQAFTKQDAVLGMSFLPRLSTAGALPTPLLQLTTPVEKQLNFRQALGYISNIATLQTAAKNAGFINVYADTDGIIRRVPLLMRYQDNLYPSLAMEAVRLFLLTNVKLVTGEYDRSRRLEAIQLGEHIIPTDARAEMLIPFRGKSYSFPYYSATNVLTKKIPLNALAGKIVFVGTTATGLSDLRATAIQGVFPGVEIQATIADGILTDHYSYKPEWTVGAEVFITLLLGLCFAFLFPYLGPRTLIILIIIIPIALILTNSLFWEKTGLIIFILIPILVTILLGILNIVYGYLFETLRRERLKEMFGQYVPEKHIDEMLKASGSYGLHGEDREMTVLFADIRNFTSISEPMTATELKDLLNQFFTPMTEIIFKYHGTIDKYIGDLIMAFWGAPLKDKRHAQHALSTALEMQEAVEKLKPQFAQRGWSEINIGIGLNSGVMSVGDMGSQFRRNYTVLGDAVNLGSRIEGLTKHYGVKIMATEATIKNQKKFIFRQLDRVRVKGKKLGITVFEVVCLETAATPALKLELAQSEQALNLYYNQQWDEALRLFNELHLAHPEVKLYKLYQERIEEFKKTPPPADWDGVYTHATK